MNWVRAIPAETTLIAAIIRTLELPILPKMVLESMHPNRYIAVIAIIAVRLMGIFCIEKLTIANTRITALIMS